MRFDSNFADAYVGLADSQYLLYDYGYDTSLKHVEAAKSNIARAMELNPNMTDAYSTLGLIQTSYDWDWPAAEESLRKAIKLGPNSPNAHHRFGTLLGRLRRFDESVAELKVAHELDPTSTSITMNLGKMLMFAKRYEDAEAEFNSTLKLDASFNAPRWYLARTQWLSGKRRDGVAMWLKAVDGDGDPELSASCSKTLAANGEQAAMTQTRRGVGQGTWPDRHKRNTTWRSSTRFSAISRKHSTGLRNQLTPTIHGPRGRTPNPISTSSAKNSASRR